MSSWLYGIWMQSLVGDSSARLSELYAELQRRHVVEVPFPLTFTELSTAADSFLSFLTLSQEEKDQFTPPAVSTRSYSIPGYRLRIREKEGARDNKEFFHYNPQFEQHLTSIPGARDPRAETFLRHARAVHMAATETLRSILTLLDAEFPGVLAEYFPPVAIENTILRFLKYDVAGEGNFLAAAHYDAGGATLALAESAPGLRVGISPETLTPVVHRSGAALFMPALHFEKKTDSRFAPVWHDVVQLSEDTLSPTTARWAIVFFANGASEAEKPDKKVVYTPKK